MDVLNDARHHRGLGVHIETNASEAGAAAMLGASINYPIRGAVTWNPPSAPTSPQTPLQPRVGRCARRRAK